MAGTGWNTTSSLADSLDTIIDSARLVRDYEGIMPKLVDRQTLPKNTGLGWEEVSLGQLTAQTITENTYLDNPQTVTDTLFSIVPVISGIQTIFTDRAQRRITKKVWSKVGGLSQNALQRKKDIDGLAIAAGATLSLAGAGQTLTSGHIRAGEAIISNGGGIEPSMGEIYTVLHSYQAKDIADEITAGVGTYNIPHGLTEDVMRKGFIGGLSAVNIYTDNNIAITSNNATGLMFAREGIVLVQGHEPRTETRRRPEIGGGADEFFFYDEYAYGERAAGQWVIKLTSDASTPTS